MVHLTSLLCSINGLYPTCSFPKAKTNVLKNVLMQAVKSLCQKLQQWVHQPDSCSAEALQWLSNFPAVVQGLVQVT